MIFFKNYKSKKQLIKENESLKKALDKEFDRKFEDYFNKNTIISAKGGEVQLLFKGTEVAHIFAASFWDLVKDSDNYVVCSFNYEGNCVDVTVQKKGKLSPLEKLKKVESMLERLTQEINSSKVNSVKIYEEALEYIARKNKMYENIIKNNKD